MIVPALLAAPAGWLVTDRLEADDDFCNACHLPDGAVLHQRHREDFDRLIPVTLSGAHGRAFLDEREEDPEFRCIDCHGGVGAVGRTRVKLLAAWDGLLYLSGDFEEPDGMAWPLGPEDCRRCHTTFRGAAAPGWGLDAYHGLPEHDGPGTPSCVDCHQVHVRGGDAYAYFMGREHVDRVCARCHEE